MSSYLKYNTLTENRSKIPLDSMKNIPGFFLQKAKKNSTQWEWNPRCKIGGQSRYQVHHKEQGRGAAAKVVIRV